MSYQKVIRKINENTQKRTYFYDFAEPFHVFERKLNVNVTPLLEKVKFYEGGRIHQYDYIPEPPEFETYLQEERQWGIRREIQLVDIFSNFKQGHVCFVGPAGSGKTTLMKATSRHALQEKYFQGIKMIQYIECKQFMNNSKVTAGELIFNSFPKEEISQAIDLAKTHPGEVLFMLDSLDTLQYTVDGVYEIITLDEPAYPEVIIWNFLAGKLFPGCRIISSSREHSIRNYWGEVRPDKVIALAGLTMESIKDIIAGYEGNEESEKIMEFLEIKAPLLLSLCTTPVMLVYTLIALKFKSDFKPNTMTGIMIVVIQSILRSPHTHQENILEVMGKLKELSCIGTLEHRVLFTENDFRLVNLKPEEATDLVILAPGGIYVKLFQGIHLLYFQHQSIQELLTSFYILGLDLKSFMKFVDEYLHTGHFVLIRRMICALLLNPVVYEEAGILLGEIKNLDEKRITLKKSLQLQLINTAYNADLLELFTALNEAKYGMSDIVKSTLHKINMFEHPLSIGNIYVIGELASYCTSLTMELGKCDLKPASLQTLASGLKGSNVKIMKLLLDRNKNMGVEGLSSVGQILSNQPSLEHLSLSDCNLSSDQLQAFKSSMGNNTQIKKLSLLGNKNMGVEGLSSVGQILSNQSCVEDLDLGSCNLSSYQLQTFNSSIGNATQINKLRLHRNTNMGVEGLSSVGQILSNQSCVEDLDLRNCNLSPLQLLAFKSSLGNNTKINKLRLLRNTNMGVKGLSSVGRVLSNQSCVEDLDLRNCSLSPRQLQAFKSSLGNYTEIDLLNLYEDRIANHKDIVAVANLLPVVNKRLSLVGWKIADEDKEILQNQLDEIGYEELEIQFDFPTKLLRKSADSATNVFSELPTTTLKTGFGETSSRITGVKSRRTSEGDRGPRSKISKTEVEEIQQAVETEPTLYALPQIENVTSQGIGSDILLTWDEGSDSNIQYNIEIFCDDVKLEETHTSVVPHYEMKSPSLGKTYRFQVFVKDEWGNTGVKTQSKNVIKGKKIGVRGDTMNLNECKVTFPDETFNEETKVWMSVRLDNSICPTEYVAITPALDISAESTLCKKAVVQMNSWRICLKKEDADILHFTNRTEFKIIKPDDIHDRTIEFHCQEFGPIIAAIKRWWYGPPPPVVQSNILYMDQNRLCITSFHLSELVERSIITGYESRGAKPVPTRFNQVILKHGDKIHVKLWVERSPVNLRFNEPNGHKFSVDDDFFMTPRHNYEFELLPNLQQYPEIVIKGEMRMNGVDKRLIRFTLPLGSPNQSLPPPINFAVASIVKHLPAQNAIEGLYESPDPKRMVNEASHVEEHLLPDIEDLCGRVGDIEVIPCDRKDYEESFGKENIYNITKPKGLALILNNNFKGTANKREGSEIDVQNMTTLWKKLGCELYGNEEFPKPWESDKTSDQMRNLLREVSEVKTKYSFIVIVIMTHGRIADKKLVFIGSDNKNVRVREIEKMFSNIKNKNLHNIPKFFIFQFCRGKLTDRGIVAAADNKKIENCMEDFGKCSDQTDGADRLPYTSDIIVAYPTLEDYVAFRSKRNGSRFINAITNVFMCQAGKNHVADMLTTVNGAMAKKGEKHKAMSEQKTCLRKRFYLFPGFPE
ncbi:uncharacterized protein LOC144432122 [Styela clava]